MLKLSMTKLIDKITEKGLADHVLTDNDLNFLLQNTAAARYGIVNKALKKGQLLRLRRGLYILPDKYRQKKLSKFYLASRIVPHSYISLESALSYYGWIPEQVNSVTSIVADIRTKKYITSFGDFVFYQLPVNQYEFFTDITRVEEVKGEPFFIASPLRALMDYVYIKKISWTNLGFLTQGLRIELDDLKKLKKNDFFAVRKVYRSKRVLNFLENLKMELKK